MNTIEYEGTVIRTASTGSGAGSGSSPRAITASAASAAAFASASAASEVTECIDSYIHIGNGNV